MVTKMNAKAKIKTKTVIKAKKSTRKPTVKTKAKMSIKALKKATTRPMPNIKARKAEIVKRVTFTTQEFKKVQQMLAANDCQNLKEWITKRISEQKLQPQSLEQKLSKKNNIPANQT